MPLRSNGGYEQREVLVVQWMKEGGNSQEINIEEITIDQTIGTSGHTDQTIGSMGAEEVHGLRGVFNWTLPAAAALGCWTVPVEWRTPAVRRPTANRKILRNMLLQGERVEENAEENAEDTERDNQFPMVRAARFVVRARIPFKVAAGWWGWWGWWSDHIDGPWSLNETANETAGEYEVPRLSPVAAEEGMSAPHLAFPSCSSSGKDRREATGGRGVSTSTIWLFATPMSRALAAGMVLVLHTRSLPGANRQVLGCFHLPCPSEREGWLSGKSEV
jgi:hypothetical protein